MPDHAYIFTIRDSFPEWEPSKYRSGIPLLPPQHLRIDKLRHSARLERGPQRRLVIILAHLVEERLLALATALVQLEERIQNPGLALLDMPKA